MKYDAKTHLEPIVCADYSSVEIVIFQFVNNIETITIVYLIRLENDYNDRGLKRQNPPSIGDICREPLCKCT